jgi:beta-lactamase class A
MREARWLALGALFFTLACGGESGTVPPPGVEPPPPADADLYPDTAAGRRLAWVIQELNGDGFSLAEIESSFTPELLAGFSAADLQRALAALSRDLAPLELHRILSPSEEHRVIGAFLSHRADWYSFKITTSEEEPHLIAGIFYEADPSLAPPAPPDWSAFRESVAEIAPRVSFLAAELDPDCRSIADSGSNLSLPIGSAFKLYVLATLVDEVKKGNRSWEELLEIRDALKSLPTGHLHLATAGSTLTLAQFAEAMISESDNTATDHLIELLGRTNVEATFTTAGHSEPARNRPLLKTREFFWLKLGASLEEQTDYLSKDETARRMYLDTELAGVDVLTLAPQARAWTSPKSLETIEWFASNEDLCRAMALLRADLGTAEAMPLAGILSKNTVFAFDDASWDFAGFKGGSEPGLLNVTWLLERRDGRWFVLSITAEDTTARISNGAVVLQAKNAIALLARE